MRFFDPLLISLFNPTNDGKSLMAAAPWRGPGDLEQQPWGVRELRNRPLPRDR